MVGLELALRPGKEGASIVEYKRTKNAAINTKGDKEDTREQGHQNGNEGHRDSSASSDATVRPEEDIQPHKSIFTFENVNYTVPVKGGSRQLLTNCRGMVKPGRMVALMGASGAGESLHVRDALPVLTRLVKVKRLYCPLFANDWVLLKETSSSTASPCRPLSSEWSVSPNRPTSTTNGPRSERLSDSALSYVNRRQSAEKTSTNTSRLSLTCSSCATTQRRGSVSVCPGLLKDD